MCNNDDEIFNRQLPRGQPTNAGGLSLAQEKYRKAFTNRCLQMIKDYDMNLFKFDGIGGGVMATGASKSVAPDLQGFLKHLAILREAKPDVFINCTVGMWPSPFWTLYADSICRGGSDWSTLGPGNPRERWITYRDDVIYTRFVQAAPLYPLNSVMSHGIIVSDQFGMAVNDSPAATDSFANEVWMGIACGTNLQEYYISTEMMSSKWWDILADGVKWLRANESTLRDTHWFGGRPSWGKVYGYASYSPTKQIMVIRNPSPKAQIYKPDYAAIFELPAGAKMGRQVKVVFATSGAKAQLVSAPIKLAPFEVKVIEFR